MNVYEIVDYYINMKRFIKLMFLMPMIILCSGCGQSNENEPVVPDEPKDPIPVDVVIISGQSNGVGCTQSAQIKKEQSLGSEKYYDYMSGFSSTKISYDCWTKDEKSQFYSQNNSKDYKFVKVMLGQGNSLATFGPEIGIAETLGDKYANKLFLIKFACGASNLKDDWAQKNSPMYPKLISYIQARMNDLKENGYIPTIKAFCWMQGEGDSYEGYYDVYLDNTRTFVTNLRTDLRELAGGKELPFIDAGICVSSAWDYPEEVNAAKAAFAAESENNIFIDTMAEGLHTNREPSDNPDLCHFDSDSEIKLGHLFAEAFDQFLMK